MNEREKAVEEFKLWSSVQTKLKKLMADISQLDKDCEGRISVANDRLVSLDAASTPQGPWEPELGCRYWYVNSVGYIIKGCRLECDPAFDGRLELGNVYRTRTAAEEAWRRQKIDARVRLAAEASGVVDEEEWFVIQCSKDHVFIQCSGPTVDVNPRFATYEAAQAAMSDIGAEDILFWLEGGE